MRKRRPVVRKPLPSMKELKKYHAEKKLRKTLQKVKVEVKEVAAKVKEEVQEVKEIIVEKVAEIKEVIEEAKEEVVEAVIESKEEIKEEVSTSLEDLSKDELMEKAQEMGITIRKNWGKKTLLSKIKNAE